MGIRLNEKDLSILLDTARFRGLTAETIRHIHFGDSSYALTRLKVLCDNGYLDRKYYYVVKKTKSGKNHAQRIAVLYYPTPKGLKAINYEIDPRYVIPEGHRLDVHYMISQLYHGIPELISKREAQEKYPVKNYMPITCVVPQEKPVFISILGKNKAHKVESKLIKFIEAKYFSGTYITISNRFPGEKLLLTDSNYIHSNVAPEVVPNIVASNPNSYLEEFVKRFSKDVVGYEDPFTMVDVSNRGVCNFAELFTGSTRLMLFLRQPPPKTYIYVNSINHLHGVKLESGSFIVFSKEEQKFYKVYLENGKMKHQLVD